MWPTRLGARSPASAGADASPDPQGATVRIGTSGWLYRHWRGVVYPPRLPMAKWLSYYAQFFSTVEINSTFYGLPSVRTVSTWRDATPAGFCFAVKGSRYLTHLKKLTDPADGLNRMNERLAPLGDKLGPILFQLPPRWPCDLDRLASFIRAVQALRPAGRYAFEFRDPTWHNPEVHRLLREHNVAWCVYDLAGFRSAIEVTADFAYVRLHGPATVAYSGTYSDDALAFWAEQVRRWRGSLSAVYIYFDNDEAGYAFRDAARLRSLVEGHAASGVSVGG